MAARAGVVGTCRVVDSTGISDSVVTSDTVTLIGSALRRCLSLLEGLDAVRAAELGACLLRGDYDASGKPQIIWADPEACRELLQELFGDASTTISICSGIGDPDVEAACVLLSRVVAQDLEIQQRDDGNPEDSIRRGWPLSGSSRG